MLFDFNVNPVMDCNKSDVRADTGIRMGVLEYHGVIVSKLVNGVCTLML